jgi:tRNA (cytidine/uridine-2'-O-)-methyltransferase
MRLAAFQPDIPQNTGALMRLGACFQVPIDIIEPCGFPFDDRRLRRSLMDYGTACVVERHDSWERFLETQRQRGGRVVLLTTAGAISHCDFHYSTDDCLLVGRESAGVPAAVAAAADARVRIPIASGLRSLNVTVAAAIVVAEALRQTGFFTDRLRL